MKKSKLMLSIVCLITASCASKIEKHFCKVFLYKPLEDSPAYMVKLPLNSTIETIISGHSDAYTFSYHDAVFYISEEYPYKSQDTLYNFLLRTQCLLQMGERIDIPIEGVLYESGRYGSTFWRYYLFYNLEKPNHIYGVSNRGFEHLYVGYAQASERDTAALNDCISSAIRINKPINKHKANKIIKCDRFYTTK